MPAEDASAKPSVVVIEDEVSFRDIVSQLLSGAGFQVQAFERAEPAIACMRESLPHVVLTDLYLGQGSTGLQVLSRVRELDAELPVVLMTAQGDIRTAIES